MSAIALLLAVAAALILRGDVQLSQSQPAPEIAALLLFGAGALALTQWAVERGRPSWRDAAGAVAMWAVFITALTAVYVQRDAALEGLRTLATEIGVGPDPAVLTAPGEVQVTRRGDGVFRIPALVNDQPQDFVFDTGASAVVLTIDTARRLGFRTEELRFRVPVSTANGRMLAAPVTLERLSIGPIAFRRVSALVAGPSLLHENLLGQTVLDKLDSYEVRGNRLVLRAKKA